MKEFTTVAPTEIRQIQQLSTGTPLAQRVVRAYANAPGTMGLQVRGLRGKTPHYAHANLTRAQVVMLRDYLNTMLEDHLAPTRETEADNAR